MLRRLGSMVAHRTSRSEHALLVDESDEPQEQRQRSLSRPEVIHHLIDAMINDQPRTLVHTLNDANLPPTFIVGQSERPLLHVASSLGALECARELLRMDADVDQQDASGTTATHLAARNGHPKLLRLLVYEHNANIRLVDSDGFTAVHWLANNGRAALLGLLLDLGQPVDLQDKSGQTALHVASHAGHAACVSFLLQCGASVCALDHKNRNALFYACKKGNEECVAVLLSHNAVVLKDEDGVDALDLCLSGKHPEAAVRLMLHDPALVLRVVRAASDASKDVDSVSACLVKYSLSGVSASRVALASVAELAATTGQKLLCPSSDVVVLEPAFARICKVLVAMVTALKSSSVARHHSVSQSWATTTTTPSKEQVISRLCSTALDILNPAWCALEEWLQLLSEDLPDDIEEGRNSVAAASGSSATASVADVVDTSLYGATKPPPPKPAAAKKRLSKLEKKKRLSRLASELSLQAGEPKCYSPSCGKDGSQQCYSSSCQTKSYRQPPISKRTHKRSDSDVYVLDLCADRIVAAIRAFAVVYEGLNNSKQANKSGGSVSYSSSNSNSNKGTVAPKLFEFVTKHVKIFRHLIARDTIIIFSQFSFLLTHSCLFRLFADVVRKQPFERRQAWFHEQLEETVDAHGRSARTLVVNRAEIFNSSCKAFMNLKEQAGGVAEAFKHNFSIEFEGEPGMGDGVKREWVALLSQELLNPNYGLFMASADGTSFQISPNSYVNPDHLTYFEFAGQAVGMALLHRQLLGVSFCRVFYKQLCGKPADYSDAALLDPEYAQSLKWILDNDITDCGLDLTFSTTTEHFGQSVQTELIPNGANITVTEENKQGFVHLLASQKLTGAVRSQMAAFKRGFYELVPPYLVSIFHEGELEILLSGTAEIDAADWEQNAQYTGYTCDHPNILRFWEVVRGMSQEERANLLKFTSGTSRLPPGGFANLRGSNGVQLFTISEDSSEDPNRLPTASTCFNLLRLPHYESTDDMRKHLCMAGNYSSEGFGFT